VKPAGARFEKTRIDDPDIAEAGSWVISRAMSAAAATAAQKRS
jgi:hypothetical protein